MSTYVVIGAGGTASHLIHALNQYILATDGEDGSIHLWDADHIEENNLTRQLFYPYEIGNHKAEALRLRFPQTIRAHHDFVGPNNLDQVIKDGDIVLICADNMHIRRLINEKAKSLKNIVIINGGNEEHSGSVQVFIRQKNKNRTPALDFYSPEIMIEDGDRSAMSCAQLAQLPGGEQTIIANMTTAALMMAALWRVHNKTYQQEKQWTKITYDHQGGSFQTTDMRLLGGLND